MKNGDRVLLRPCQGYQFHRWANVVRVSAKGKSAEFVCTNGDRVTLTGSALHNGIEPDQNVAVAKDAERREIDESVNCAVRAKDRVGPLLDLVRSMSSPWHGASKPIPAELRERLDACAKEAIAIYQVLRLYV